MCPHDHFRSCDSDDDYHGLISTFTATTNSSLARGCHHRLRSSPQLPRWLWLLLSLFSPLWAAQSQTATVAMGTSSTPFLTSQSSSTMAAGLIASTLISGSQLAVGTSSFTPFLTSQTSSTLAVGCNSLPSSYSSTAPSNTRGMELWDQPNQPVGFCSPPKKLEKHTLYTNHFSLPGSRNGHGFIMTRWMTPLIAMYVWKHPSC